MFLPFCLFALLVSEITRVELIKRCAVRLQPIAGLVADCGKSALTGRTGWLDRSAEAFVTFDRQRRRIGYICVDDEYGDLE